MRSLSIILDDVGTKADADGLPTPTWSVETSPGNYQFGYVWESTPSNEKVESLLQQIRKAGLADKNGNTIIRWARLPFDAINTKKAHQQPDGSFPRCRLVHWNPETRYTVESLSQALGDRLPAGKTETTAEVISFSGKTPDLDDYCREMIVRAARQSAKRTWDDPGLGRSQEIYQMANNIRRDCGWSGAGEFSKEFAGQVADLALSTFESRMRPCDTQGEVKSMNRPKELASFIKGLNSHLKTPDRALPFEDLSAANDSENPSKGPTRMDEYQYSLEGLSPVEYGVDGLTSTGITLIAGPQGVGKTTLLVPLAAAVARLLNAPELSEHGFNIKPTLRRKVVYVTEAPEQVGRCLYGVKKHLYVGDTDSFREAFHIFEARRLAPKELAALIRDIREKFGFNDPEHNNYRIEPLIVFDTSNATLNLESENDNAEVGQALAAIKESLGRGMLWLVCHVPKAVSKADASNFTARGASAFEADCQAVAYLGKDDNLPRKRFMLLGKRRFETETTEIEFETFVGTELTFPEWGGEQVEQYRYGIPRLLRMGDLNAQKERAKADRDEAHSTELRKKILNKLEEQMIDDEWNGISKRALAKLVGGKTETVTAEIDYMADEGLIDRVIIGTAKNAAQLFRPNRETLGKHLATPD